MRRDCPTLHGYPGTCRGTGRQTFNIAPTIRPTVAYRQLTSTNCKAMTQASVQLPRAQGEMNAMTLQEARASNAVVEGTICIFENIA